MASLKKRGPVYYIQFYQGEKQRRISTETESFQQAKEKLRQFESVQARGEDSPLPTKTPIVDVLTAYVAHVRATKTAKSAQTDIYYLRDAFGPCCEAVKVTSRKLSSKTKKRPPNRHDAGCRTREMERFRWATRSLAVVLIQGLSKSAADRR